MKGLNPLISHTMAILFSVLIITVTVAAFNTITEENRKFLAENEMIIVCDIIKSSVEELNSANYVSASNYTSTADINLPEKVAGFTYRTTFSGSTLKIETVSVPVMNETCKMGFNMTYTGSGRGGKTRIELTYKDSGIREVFITRG